MTKLGVHIVKESMCLMLVNMQLIHIIMYDGEFAMWAKCEAQVLLDQWMGPLIKIAVFIFCLFFVFPCYLRAKSKC